MKNLIGKDDKSGTPRGVHDDKEDYWKTPLISKPPYPDMFGDIYLFHSKAGAYIGMKPKVPQLEVVQLREKLIEEEYREVVDALHSENLASIAQELVDLIVVTLGTAVSYGIDLNQVWNLVQKANMAKVGGPKREDGKILKPEGWQRPDVATEIKKQRGE